MNRIATWYKLGTPWLWLSVGAISLCLIIVVGIVGFIAEQAIPHFWPSTINKIVINDKDNRKLTYYGELYDNEQVIISGKEINRSLYKIGNRDYIGSDFIWVNNSEIIESKVDGNIVVFERREWGNMYGVITGFMGSGDNLTASDQYWSELKRQVDRAIALHDEIGNIQKEDIGGINYQLEEIRLHLRYLELENRITEHDRKDADKQIAKLKVAYAGLNKKIKIMRKELLRDQVKVAINIGVDTKEVYVPVANIIRVYKPNGLSIYKKISVYFDRLDEYIFDEPREANTEGGVFPAIFGTVLMVLLMTIFVTPFGILAAIYLREYSKQGFITRLIRIAVVNLAGVPSVVYGVFGLGFFVYIIGGNIDELFYPEALPAPTFGTPGILWASITLALLTLPVVIVTTEEGLARIPRTLIEGSMALGATKSETLWKIILPISTPSMITGLILAIARAAGEVAPLMLVGVVKLAPSLPLDGNFPYLHMERKFMHLGFHIYDVGFQSPNVEAARPLVFATAFLLIVVIVLLNIAAIAIRNRLREKYKTLTN